MIEKKKNGVFAEILLKILKFLPLMILVACACGMIAFVLCSHFLDKEYVSNGSFRALTGNSSSANNQAASLINNNYDCVYSTNFFPLVAKCCDRYNVKYISWSYDSPLDEKLTDYFGYDTNHIFLFDKLEVHKLRQAGYINVYHLPLAVNVDRIEKRISIQKTVRNTEQGSAKMPRKTGC